MQFLYFLKLQVQVCPFSPCIQTALKADYFSLSFLETLTFAWQRLKRKFLGRLSSRILSNFFAPAPAISWRLIILGERIHMWGNLNAIKPFTWLTTLSLISHSSAILKGAASGVCSALPFKATVCLSSSSILDLVASWFSRSWMKKERERKKKEDKIF